MGGRVLLELYRPIRWWNKCLWDLF